MDDLAMEVEMSGSVPDRSLGYLLAPSTSPSFLFGEERIHSSTRGRLGLCVPAETDFDMWALALR